MNESISQSGLDAKINSLDKGLDTQLYKIFDSQGVEFSKGEAQKLALARAIYKNGAILVLDEPTSGLDPVVRSEILDIFRDFIQNDECSILFSNVLKWSEELTVIFISHRLSSTRNCNKILVFDDGKIVEKGDHNN